MGNMGSDTSNTLEIIAIGIHIKCMINGEEATASDGSGLFHDAIHKKYNAGMNSHIAQQLHNKSQLKARFKDIEILGL